MFRIQHGNQSIILRYLLLVKVLRQVKILRQIASYTLHNDYYGQVTNLNVPAYTVGFLSVCSQTITFQHFEHDLCYISKEHAAILSYNAYSISLLMLLFYKPLTHIVCQVISIFHFSILLAWVLANSSTWL